MKLLDVKNLTTEFKTEAGTVKAVNNISFSVDKGRIVGLVGESGCGKSVTSLSVMRLLPKPSGNITHGTIHLNDTDITALSKDAMHSIRGKKIAMIFQEPMTSLNPVHRIGKQIGEVYKIHFDGLTPAQIREKSREMLEKVGIPEPEKKLSHYPHQLSGGMRQRVMVAMALAGEPDLLIADEPTTALDVTIQAQIIDLIIRIQKETGMSVIFITHDLGVIAEICHEVLVMYAGRVVERADKNALFKTPKHPYTQGLLASILTLSTEDGKRLETIPGAVPSLHDLPKGCVFLNRCPKKMDICETAMPDEITVSTDHGVACWLYVNTGTPGDDHDQ